MGALISGAVHALRCPEEANLRAPESVVAVHTSYIAAGAELIETNTFGANRRKLARVLLEDAFEEINSAGVRLAREAERSPAATCSSPARSVRSASSRCSTWRSTARATRSRRRCSRAAASTCSWSRRSSTSTSSSSPSRPCASVSSLPIVALLTFDDEAEVTGGVEPRTRCRAARRTRRRRDRDEPRRRADTSRCGRSRGMRDAGRPARRAAEHRPREPRRRTGRLPPLDAGLLRRVRRPGGRARRADRRRLLRHDARPDRGDPRSVRDRPRTRRRCSRSTSRARRLAAGRRAARRRSPGRSASSEWVVCVELDPPKGGSLDGLVEVARTMPGVRRGRLRRRERQPDGAGADERADDVGDAPARGRDRDDPPRHAARHDGDGARGRLLGAHADGRAQRARRDGRPAARRRLPRLARRVRGRLDRARPADLRPEPGRGLRRQGRSTRRPRSSSAWPSTRPPTTSSSSSSGSDGRSTRARSSR